MAALVIAAAVLTANSFDAAAWGQKGHDVTCAIAQRHLTKRAKKKIAGIFEGKTIIYWANWMDNASHTPEFAYTKTWHYKDIGIGEDYDTSVLNENGDVVTAIESQVAALQSGTLTEQATATAL